MSLNYEIAPDTCPNCSGWGYRLWAGFDTDEELDKDPCEHCNGTGLIGGAA